MASFNEAAAIFLVLSLSLQSVMVGALTCYQCGTGSDKDDDACEVLPRVANYIVECQAEDYCSKMITKIWNAPLRCMKNAASAPLRCMKKAASGDNTHVRTTRGCAAPITISGKLHELGCHVDQRTGGEICYCNYNLCNGASVAGNSARLDVTLVAFFAILTAYQFCL